MEIFALAKQHRKLLKALLLSFALHGLFTFLFYLSAPIVSLSLPKTQQTLEVTVIEKPSSGTTRNSVQKSAGNTKKNSQPSGRGKKSFRLNDFAPQFNIGPSSDSSDLAFNHGDSDLTSPDNPNADWGEGGGEFGRISDYILMERIYQQVDGLLFYPTLLAYHKVQGDVKARLVINNKGQCDWKHTEIKSGERHFQVYILGLLKKLCALNNEHLKKMRTASNIDMSFSFTVTATPADELRKKQKQPIVGNVLLFYRETVRSPTEWSLGPIKGVFPLPIAFVDFIWLQENWDRYINGIDPWEEYRPRN